MARKFRFRLEAVERLRRRERDAQRRVVAARLRAAGQTAERLADLTSRAERVTADLRDDRIRRSLDVASVRRYLIHQGWLQRGMERCREEMAQSRRELAAEQDKLAETSKRLKVIEMLRERQWSRYAVQVAREEQAAMDEAALSTCVGAVPLRIGDGENSP